MGNIQIGILGTSEIAFRRFLPALSACQEFEYVGVASRTLDRGEAFVESFGGRIYDGYDALLADRSVEAVYIPLPPALHFEWGKKALEKGKHLLMEKPFTTSAKDTATLLQLAEENGLAAHENYMFLYHNQLEWIEGQVKAGVIGELRLIRAAFGFPKRAETDFRYNKALGGGALLDCGGYPVRLAIQLLGETTRVTTSRLSQPAGYEVDLYGSATLENEAGQVAQISFGMDNCYKCELELWGSEGCITAERIFTAPADVAPKIHTNLKNVSSTLSLPADDSFRNSIAAFESQIRQHNDRHGCIACIQQQAALVDAIRGKEQTL